MDNQQNTPAQAFWQLDKTKAAKVGQLAYINGNSAEIYQIVSAAWKTGTNSQTRVDNYFMSLHIMNADKSTAHVDVYYANSDGERWSGENIINAIMLCANVPSLSQAQGSFMQYDFDQKKDVQVNGMVAHELVGKKVGLFLAENYYFNQKSGEVKRGGLNVFNVFDAQTRQLPNEKSNNTPATQESFEAVMQAMMKSSAKSLDDANKKAGINPMQQNQFGGQSSGTQQGGVTYQRGAPAQQNQPQDTIPSNNYPPLDDGSDIPF